ncbi:hypothetical protein Ciccas_011581 [Cichlidogyrus casuarinus]|uniref:Uncharacterized protein n=1 Tax=Cichlidogyrus casuarinus TaxID=1844966 RepID=A0ABD2PRQ6_9PLAT
MYLPQRVLVRLPACKPLPLSDYKFCSETQDEIVARLIWLSLPLGSHSISDSQSSLLSSLSTTNASRRLSSVEPELSPDSGNDSLAEEPQIAIDASCVDFCLEATPNANQQETISERELFQEIDQSIKNVTRHSKSAVYCTICSVVVLLLCIFVGYISTLSSPQ